MPYCTRCEVEYLEGFTACADCGAPLADSLPDGDDEAPEWTLLTEVARDTEARLVQGRLQAEGIPCALESRTFTAEPLPSVRSFMRVGLHVPARELERARAVLAECEAAAAGDASEVVE
jgi:hypothetical protein